MIKRVNRDFVYDFAIKYFPNFSLDDDVFNRNFVYLDDDNIIGFVSYSVIYERAEIEFICVSESYRGRGISDKLMDFLYSDVLGCDNISLEVRSDNLRAINFYLKHGFKKVAIRKNYYDNCDGILMVKELEVKK